MYHRVRDIKKTSFPVVVFDEEVPISISVTKIIRYFFLKLAFIEQGMFQRLIGPL